MASSFINVPLSALSVGVNPFTKAKATLDIGMLQKIGAVGVRPGIDFGIFNPRPTPTETPTSPTASATDLQVLMASIPAAEDGDVIRSEHFNLMRQAMFELASRLGVGTLKTDLVETVIPAFRKIGSEPEWAGDPGAAKAEVGAGSPVTFRGWMEVELVDGGRIGEMKVFGTAGNPATVTLRRRKITNTTEEVDLIKVTLKPETKPEQGESAPLSVSISDPAALEGFRVIDNRSYTYFLVAESTVEAGKNVRLTAIQVVSELGAT
jgi:hypothetical protein